MLEPAQRAHKLALSGRGADVRAKFSEFRAETEIRQAVKAGDETVDYSLRHQVQAGNSGEHGRIEETLQHLFLRPSRAAACVPVAGAEFRPNQCGPIRRGNLKGCDGEARELPAQ